MFCEDEEKGIHRKKIGRKSMFLPLFRSAKKKHKKQKRDLWPTWPLLVHTFTIVLGNFFAHTNRHFVPNSSSHSSHTPLTTTVKNDDDDDDDDDERFFGCTHDAKICLLDEL